MKEDVLEQIVDDYLQNKGYFTRHNVKFRPSDKRRDYDAQKDTVHSDIDVIGVNPLKREHEQVYVVSCKSWQAGFHVRSKLEEVTKNKIRSGRESWKAFRELVVPKWSEAFTETIQQVTGHRRFTYVMAVTRVIGDRKEWENHRPFLRALRGNPIKIVALPEMLEELLQRTTTTLASSEVGRLLQVIKASKWLDG